jgi:peptidoglycan/LPS O-acetylase OafA/YrhL
VITPRCAGVLSCRLTSLDSVRGIAAFIVTLYHCYLVLPDATRDGLSASIWARPINVLINGDASVIIFFVLSGYVLALPFFRKNRTSYLHYALRRLCRIYIPFAAATCIAAVFCRVSDIKECIAAAGSWFNLVRWQWSGLSNFAGHFAMTKTSLDGVLWSLIYEIRISMIFPALIILCRDTRVALLATAIMAVASNTALHALGEGAPWFSADHLSSTVVWTVRIVPYFVVGILLNKHSELYIFSGPHVYTSLWLDALYDLGAAMVIILALDVRSFAALLDRSVFQWIGRISYSLYLIHLPVLLTLFYVLLGHVPFVFVAALAIISSLVAATLMHRFVEVPAINLGRRITQRSNTQRALRESAELPV